MNRVRSLYLQSFGLPGDAAAQLGAVHSVLAGLFVITALPLLLAVNLVTLIFGVSVNFLGRDGVKFTFLRLWGRVPAVYLMLPVLIAYGLWHKWQTVGVVELFSTLAATLATAIGVVGLISVLSRLRGGR